MSGDGDKQKPIAMEDDHRIMKTRVNWHRLVLMIVYSTVYQVQDLELTAGQFWMTHPSRETFPFEVDPQCLVGVELIHKSLKAALSQRKIVNWIHCKSVEKP